MPTRPTESAQDLRRRAEELFQASETLIPELTSPEETKRLIHELRVHQIQLEMQNEELRRAHEELGASQSRYYDLYDMAPVGYLTISAKKMIKGANLRVSPAQNGEYWIAISDISERKQVDEELKESQKHLAGIIEGTRAGTWEWNVQTGETVFNEQWAEIIGYTLDELSPVTIKTWLKYAHPDDLLKSGELLEKHFRGESGYYEFESRMKHKDGQWIWVLDRGKVSTWSDDRKPLWMFGTHQDITDRKLAEEKLQHARITADEATLAKGRFLSMVAHEFHTPLHLLTISTDILDRYGERLSSDERQRQHRQIQNAARQISAMISSVSTFNQHGDSGGGQAPELLSIAQTCIIIADEVSLVWGKEHDFQVSIASDCGTTMMVKPLFQQLMGNLLTNAFRFTPTGGSVSLSVCRSGNNLLIEVADTGIGIPEEEQNKIYEAFYRGSNINMRQGLGLGLSIANVALKKLNGSIVLSSKVGTGSIFNVEIPLLDDSVAKEQLT